MDLFPHVISLDIFIFAFFLIFHAIILPNSLYVASILVLHHLAFLLVTLLTFYSC